MLFLSCTSGGTSKLDASCNLEGRAVVTGLIAMVAHESRLHFWSDIGAIVGGAIAATAFAFGIGRWIWRAFTGGDLKHGLAAGYANPIFGIDTESALAEVEVGVALVSTKEFPLIYEVRTCTVTIGEYVSEFTGEWTDELPAKQTTAFWRDPIILGRDALASPVLIDYSIAYGRPGRTPRRIITGQHRHPFRLPPGDIPPGTTTSIPTVHRSAPMRDEALPLLRPKLKAFKGRLASLTRQSTPCT